MCYSSSLAALARYGHAVCTCLRRRQLHARPKPSRTCPPQHDIARAQQLLRRPLTWGHAHMQRVLQHRGGESGVVDEAEATWRREAVAEKEGAKVAVASHYCLWHPFRLSPAILLFPISISLSLSLSLCLTPSLSPSLYLPLPHPPSLFFSLYTYTHHCPQTSHESVVYPR